MRHSAPQRDPAGDISRSIRVLCCPQSRFSCSSLRNWIWELDGCLPVGAPQEGIPCHSQTQLLSYFPPSLLRPLRKNNNVFRMLPLDPTSHP